MNLKLAIVTLGTLAVVGFGCSGTNNGTYQQNWTIQGTTNPTACSVAGASQMRVVTIGAGGAVQATNFVPCNAFTTSFSLEPATYTAAATFLATNGAAVSQTKVLPAFTVFENQTTVQTIDFAASDFLPP